MTADEQRTETLAIRVHAPSARRLGVVLEPLGEIFELNPGDEAIVTYAGVAGEELEITLEERAGGGTYLKFWEPTNGELEASICPAAH